MAEHFLLCNYCLLRFLACGCSAWGGTVAVRSERSRVSSPGAAGQQSRLNAWHAFLVAHAALEPILNRELEAACGLPLRWFDVLTQLHLTPHKRLSMIELAGLVQRAAAPGDRRSLLIVLTQSGETTLKRAAPIHEDGIRRHFAAYIMDNEAAAVEATLGRIAAAARQDDAFASQPTSAGI